jgi:hypothetical protein
LPVRVLGTSSRPGASAIQWGLREFKVLSPIMIAIKNYASVDASRIKGRVIMSNNTSLSTVSKAVLGLILSIVAATAAAEE